MYTLYSNVKCHCVHFVLKCHCVDFAVQEVKDALDKEAVCRCLTACYEMYQAEKKTKLEGLGKGPDGAGGYLQSAKTIAAFGGSLLQGVVVSCVRHHM